MMPLSLPAIRLTVLLCFGAPHCAVPKPLWFATWRQCAETGAAMMAHSREVAMGVVGFSCNSVGGRHG